MILTGTHQSIAQVRDINDLKYVLYQMVDAINRLSGNATATTRIITSGATTTTTTTTAEEHLAWLGM